ncbi:peptidoglycan/xylan/chitin deacetylase (PgdA/CDA1 family) [Ciceribacter lividus]|uniref:Chitooligosaccharide deacetylase n=1 Tax=Ciceribacter lividus TaxID=1197950 RepID=A0A6I7HH09_9HYPH|nr:polysaccharide deacetylase family protein [Ciceribacter lividus]RCW20224.1 peptidoglycan/xylan/chitin deacetylase (PgdA/CDA1 family) [Ciceribacter lividus]
MRLFFLFATLAASLVVPATAGARDGLVEPKLVIARGGPAAPRIALTLDACSGAADERILGELFREEIPATIFVTTRWVRRNPEVVKRLQSRPDLFEIEDHGENHVPAVDRPLAVYGIPAAGSPAAVAAEVEGGARAIVAAGSPVPRWFRGATARYSTTAIAEIEKMGYRIAGYSVNGDQGAGLIAGMAEKRIAAAKDGDVIIAHVNQPSRSAGEGVARGIHALKEKGVTFVRLDAGLAAPTAGAAGRAISGPLLPAGEKLARSAG